MLLARMNLVAIPTKMGVEVQSARELGFRVVSEGKQGDTYHEHPLGIFAYLQNGSCLPGNHRVCRS